MIHLVRSNVRFARDVGDDQASARVEHRGLCRTASVPIEHAIDDRSLPVAQMISA